MKRSRINYGHLLSLIVIFLMFILLIYVGISFVRRNLSKQTFYLSGEVSSIPLYDEELKEVSSIPRGQEVKTSKKITHEGETYYKVKLEKTEYYISSSNLEKKKENIVKEKTMYVRTPSTIYETLDTSDILSYAKKGTAFEVLGYDYVEESGIVHKYRIQVGEKEGYIYGKYLVNKEEDSLKNYDEDGNYQIHKSRGNTLLGGSAANLDYFPVEKPNFEENVMPEEVRALYLNSSVLGSVDEYIEIAQESNINAFVIDIKDNTATGYASKVMEELSPTSYSHAINSFDSYKAAIQKLKDAGFYLIGRITTFKDSYYIKDHPEDAILDTETKEPLNHDGSYWPSAYSRNVWEYNVKLAKEAVTEMGFHEIQFDYVRFPDRTISKEKQGLINFQNTYSEEKAQAIQNFLRYACDEIHAVGAYVSADVFGESAHNYVTGYGQYWGAISNVVDVISAMPYPELFNKYEYGFKVPVWTVPYELLNYWATNYVLKQQSYIPTPAVVRTWIQAYDATWKNPKAYYDSDMVSKEIEGLYSAGLRSGFITWNAGSSKTKYRELKDALKKEY